MQQELEALDAALGNPARPVVAIVGGAKVSTKLDLLGNLSGKVDVLVIGGAMANTFLAAQGHADGQVPAGSGDARHRTRHPGQAQAKRNCEIVLPRDLVVADRVPCQRRDPHRGRGLACRADSMALDVGPATVDLDRGPAAQSIRPWSGTVRSAPSRRRLSTPPRWPWRRPWPVWATAPD